MISSNCRLCFSQRPHWKMTPLADWLAGWPINQTKYIFWNSIQSVLNPAKWKENRMSIEIEKDRFWMDTRIGDSRYLGLVRSGFYTLLEFSVSQLTPEDPGLNPRAIGQFHLTCIYCHCKKKRLKEARNGQFFKAQILNWLSSIKI